MLAAILTLCGIMVMTSCSNNDDDPAGQSDQEYKGVPLANRLSMVIKYRFQDRMGSYTDTSGQVQAYHPYSVVDARLTWQTDTYSLYAEANNLFNKRYVDFGNVPQPGCWLLAGAAITLGGSQDR